MSHGFPFLRRLPSFGPGWLLVALALFSLVGSLACGGDDDGNESAGAGGGIATSPTAAGGGSNATGGPGVEGSLKSTGALEGTWTWKAPAIAGCGISKPQSFEVSLNDGAGKFMNVKFAEDGTWKAQSGALRSSIEGTGAKISASQSGTKASMQVEVNGTGRGDAGTLTLSGSLKVQCN